MEKLNNHNLKTVDFNPGVGENFLTSAGGLDAFVFQLNSDATSINPVTAAAVTVYPNPAHENIVVRCDDGHVENVWK